MLNNTPITERGNLYDNYIWVMKELILSHLKTVQSVMDGTLTHLKDKHDPSGHFNYYWDELAFIIWMKTEDPIDYEACDLDTCFEILDEFGDVFVRVIEPARIPYIYRHDDGILNIDVPIQKMIRQFYDYVINLQESELIGMKSELDTLSLKDIMNEILALKANVGTALQNKHAADTAGLAKEVVKEVLSPSKPQQKLTKKQQLEADIAKGVAEHKLKMIQNASKQRK